jgi:ATP-binding cassette subfamily C protein CydC
MTTATTRPQTRRDDPLRRAVALLALSPRTLALSVLLGVLALGSAVALAAVSAWLIARASQMPPVLQLSVATVAVRAFGIGRGVFRYAERLTSHDLALRGMAHLRETLYARLAAGRTESLVGLRRGDLLARVGADVDAVGDVVVRGLLPAAVAAVLGLGTVLAIGAFLPAAGLSLAVCLLVAGVVAPLLAARAARRSEELAARSRADMTATALTVLDDPGQLTVSGQLAGQLDLLRDADRRLAAATDTGARPAAVSAALGTLAVGAAVVAALMLGIPAVGRGALTPVELAVVVLTPLAAFEATSLLPAAAVQVLRSRLAAARVMALLDSVDSVDTVRTVRPAVLLDTEAPVPAAGHPVLQVADTSAVSGAASADPHGLVARDLACGWPGRPSVVTGLDLTVRPGRSVAVVGPSGTGKTTLLLTLAGLLPPHGGSLTVDGVPVALLGSEQVARSVVLTAEDAHVFETTVLENLRVANGATTADEARAALRRAGLGGWLDALPDGVQTMLGPDALNVSGGERRRLLLARALVSPAEILLVDEPAEHLDTETADALVRDLLSGSFRGGPTARAASAETSRGVVVVTHRLTPLDTADEVIVISDGSVQARGTHAELLRRDSGYRDSLWRENQGSAASS